MAEIFKPIEDFTEVIPSGNEEIQVSDTEKVTLSKNCCLSFISVSFRVFLLFPIHQREILIMKILFLEAIEKDS